MLEFWSPQQQANKRGNWIVAYTHMIFIDKKYRHAIGYYCCWSDSAEEAVAAFRRTKISRDLSDCNVVSAYERRKVYV